MYKRSHIMLFGLSLFLLVVLAVYVGYEAWLLSFFIILFLISLLVTVIIGLIIMPFYKKTTILLNRFGVYPGNLFQFSKALDSLEKILVKKQLEIEQIPITIAEKIRSQEYIDNQTQLGNRRFFDARLDELLLTQSHSGTGVVILLSLTELQKTKEKKLTEEIKTQIVKEVAVLLQNVFKDKNEVVVSRRDEYSFSILIHPLLKNQLEEWINKIIQAFKLLKHTDLINATQLFHMGAASFVPGCQRYQLLATADLALRTSQLKGAGCWSVITEDNMAKRGMVQWRILFENTLDQHNIQIYQQNLINLDNHNIVHREVFTRLLDENKQEIFASEFIPMASASGFLEPLERLIIDQVIKNIVYKQDKITHPVAINISISSICEHKFIEWLLKRLSCTPMLAENISVELRESKELLDNSIAFQHLGLLKSMGVRIGIDHVGEQLVSLNYLKHSVIDYVKIHQSVMIQLSSEDSFSSELFIKSLAEIAAIHQFVLYAEGVENLFQVNLLKSLQVAAGQGFLLGTPELFSV